MKELIGLWFIVLAMSIMIIGFCTDEDKDKKMVYILSFMIFFGCLEIGVYLLVS